MRLTIAICTFNRSALLRQALASLAACRLPDGDLDLLIVDNNSTDDTQGVVREFHGRLPIRYCFEPQQGLSAARNRAIAECRGDALLFTDDDVRFDPDWIECYAREIARHPEAGWFGGRVRPHWDEGRPGWLKDDRLSLIDGLLVHYDLGDRGRAYTPDDQSPFGASFALRRSVFERFGGFRLDLGVKGQVPGRGEEAEYFDRVRMAGVPGWYVGESSAWHWQDPRRFRFPHLYRYGFEKGVAELRLNGVMNSPRGSLVGEASFFVKAMGQWVKGRGDRARQCVINMGIQRGLRSRAR